MKDDEEFKKALADKQVPILVLDEKWHRLFAVHGKPDEIHETENELNALLARQGNSFCKTVPLSDQAGIA